MVMLRRKRLVTGSHTNSCGICHEKLELRKRALLCTFTLLPTV